MLKAESFGHGVIAIKKLLKIKQWSIAKENENFPGKMDGRQKGDAYRHVLASVLSRKIVGRSMASSSGFVNELLRDLRRTNTPRDRFMDLHNNRVGRVDAYDILVGKTNKETAQKVLDYLNTSGHLLLTNWGGTTPPKQQAKMVANAKLNRGKVIVY